MNNPLSQFPNITLTQLSYVLAVARLRHFGAAARACHVTQPTLSMQIQKLEQGLDLVVFDRTKKPVMVTEAGRELVEQAGEVVRQMQRLGEVAARAHGEVRGDFHLGVIPTLAPHLLPRFLPGFGARYPGVRLFVAELQTEAITRQLQEGGLDAGLLATPLGGRGLVEQPLFHEPFAVYAAQGHPLLRRRRLRREDLRYDDIWLLSEGHCLRAQVLNLCDLRLGPADERRLHFDSGSLATLVRLIDSGLGYTLVPALAAEELGEEGRGRLRPFAGDPPVRQVSLVYGRALLKRAIIGALAEAVREAVPVALRSAPATSQVVPIQPRH